MLSLFRYELFSRWRAVLGWGIGLAAFASMYVGVYPEMEEELAGLAGLSIYRALGMDVGSFAGFVASAVIQIMPLILGVYVIMASTAILGGEEDDGTLELLVTMPMHRWQVVTAKAAALGVVLLLILVVLGAGTAFTLSLVARVADVNVTPMQLFTGLLSAWPMALAFSMLGLLLGATLPNRRMAVTVMSFIYIGSYVIQSITRIVDSLDFLAPLSLFTYLNTSASIFEQGVNLADVAVLLLVAAVFFGLTLLSFQRRNLTVGQWSWQRGRVPAGE